jgi:hypothetical protein
MITIIIPIPVLTERHTIILWERSQVLLESDIRDDLIGTVTYACLIDGHELVLHCVQYGYLMLGGKLNR